MDTGGLAHMTYNMSLNGSSLGVPGSGFASRGKGSQLKRLSVPHLSKLGTSDVPQPLPSAGPRTSRSHLLAGLRTAPKQPSTPVTAPIMSHMNGNQDGRQSLHSVYGQTPHTAATTGAFPNMGGNNYLGASRQMYSLPEHVLAPPPIDFQVDENGNPVDQHLYAELVQANLYLAAQQQRLQQQLASVTAAAQQFQNLNLGTPTQQQQQFYSPAFQSPMAFYQQQAQQGLQPVVQAVPGQPGVYAVYNPMTGQYNLVVDDSARQQEELAGLNSPQEQYRQSPLDRPSNVRNSSYASAPEQRRSPVHNQSPPPRVASSSPTTTTTQPDVAPLPTPSSAAFKRGHRKNGSIALKIGVEPTPRSAGYPATPATGTFGPGQGRAGEHPIRQPRGPPSLEELVAKPTSKFEGSKNFVTRQRRRAVNNLVRAGMERRSGNSSTGGSLTPTSDSDFNFSPTDGEDSGNRSASVSSHPSIGSLRSMSDSKEEGKKRTSYENLRSPTGVPLPGSPFAEEFAKANNTITSPTGGLPPTAADIVAGRGAAAAPSSGGQSVPRRRMPMFVLSSAEKRKSPQ